MARSARRKDLTPSGKAADLSAQPPGGSYIFSRLEHCVRSEEERTVLALRLNGDSDVLL